MRHDTPYCAECNPPSALLPLYTLPSLGVASRRAYESTHRRVTDGQLAVAGRQALHRYVVDIGGLWQGVSHAGTFGASGLGVSVDEGGVHKRGRRCVGNLWDEG